jgi:trehalose synthase
MLQRVDVGERSVEDYRGVVTDDLLDELHAVAKDLRGLRVLNLNATPYGGEVAAALCDIGQQEMP